MRRTGRPRVLTLTRLGVVSLIVAALGACDEAPTDRGPLLGSISGQVTLEGVPFPGVTVSISRAPDFYESRVANKNGDYLFPGIATGQYQVTVSGYSNSIHFAESRKTVLLRAVGQITATVNFNGKWVGSAREDRDALNVLYYRTGGANWANATNWLTDLALSEWHGITTNARGRVTGINLPLNRMTGTIPPELANLQSLIYLDLTANHLTGALPPELGELESLERLSLSRNEISGQFPSSFRELTHLKYLDLTSNLLKDSLPPSIGELTELRSLLLAGNRFSGSIPHEIGSLTQLMHLDLSSNQFNGIIPASFGSLIQLNVMQLSDNQIRGPIPSELGRLELLESLNLTRNEITGPIPPSIGSLPLLENLLLSMNDIGGHLPAELGNLSSLRNLDVSTNALEGPLPASLGSLVHLGILRLASNSISGNIPDSLGAMSSLTELELGENRLTGEIPSSLGRLSILETLDLSRNRLVGPIPPELSGLDSIAELDLSENALSGTIPRQLEGLGNLRELHLNTNVLTGPLPPEIGDLTALSNLQVGKNALGGLLPRSMTELGLDAFNFTETGLCAPSDAAFSLWLRQIVYLAENLCSAATRDRVALTDLYWTTGGEDWARSQGWISEAPLSQWDGVETNEQGRVTELSLGENGLTGPIPLSIVALDGLINLGLEENSLTGRVPGDIGALTHLRNLRLNGNLLSGPLPAEMTDLTPDLLDFSATDLCAPPGETFQDWLRQIPDARGGTCKLPTRVKLDLPIVYLTQGAQRTDGTVPLVAGQDALIRVIVTSDPVSFYAPEVEARLYRNGRETYSVRIARGEVPLEPIPNEGSLDASYNARIAGGLLVPGTEMVVELDPGGVVPLAEGSVTRFPAEGTLPLDVRVVSAMELTVVPVIRSGWSDTSVLKWTRGMTALGPKAGLLRKTLPTGALNLAVRGTYVTTANLQTFTGWGEFLREIGLLRQAEGSRGYYYGAVSKLQAGYVQGFAFRGVPVAVGITDSVVMAHELGHSMGLGHAPCGGANSPDPDYPHPSGRIGVWGIDIAERRLIPPAYGRDLMGYCYGDGREWISDYHFEKALDFRMNHEEMSGDVPTSDRTGATATTELVPSLVIWGVADGPHGPSLDPSVIIDVAPPPADPMSAVSEGLDSRSVGLSRAGVPPPPPIFRAMGEGLDGAILFEHLFRPVEDEHGTRHFVLTVPMDPGWAGSLARITVSGPGGAASLGAGDAEPLAIVTDKSNGRVLAVLRDWSGQVPSLVGSEATVAVSDGVPSTAEQVEAVRKLLTRRKR